MDPVTKKLLIHWGVDGGPALLSFLWTVYRLYTTQP